MHPFNNHKTQTMRKMFSMVALIMLCATFSIFAQAPQSLNYQAVVRDSQNKPIANAAISLEASILQGSDNGASVYTETHTTTTNANGLYTILIGKGTTTGDFSKIDWSKGPYFVKTITTANGKTIEGVSPLASVPYALYAETAGNVDLSGYIQKSEIMSLLANTEFIKISDVLAALDEYAKKTDIDTKLADYSTTENVNDTLDFYVLKKNMPSAVDLSDYATTAKVNDTIDYYVMKESLADSLTNYVKKSSMSDYYTKSEVDTKLNSYATQSYVSSNYVSKTSLTTTLNDYVKKSDLANYATKDEVKAMYEKCMSFQQMEGEIPGVFSVSATKKIVFSKGNLQYNKNTRKWRFAENQYETTKKAAINATYSKYSQVDGEGWTDLFCWGTSGWSSYSGDAYYSPSELFATDFSTTKTTGPAATEFLVGNSRSYSLTGDYAKADWGVYNAITNGENKAGIWRTLTKDEWEYLFNSRTDAKKKRCKAQIIGVNSDISNSGTVAGFLLIPDDWDVTKETEAGVVSQIKNNVGTETVVTMSISALQRLERKYGVVFLPNYKGDGELVKNYENNSGLMFKIANVDKSYYWSATALNSDMYCYAFDLSKSNAANINLVSYYRNEFLFVRLVRDYE